MTSCSDTLLHSIPDQNTPKTLTWICKQTNLYRPVEFWESVLLSNEIKQKQSGLMDQQ